MAHFDHQELQYVGETGFLPIKDGDEVVLKLAMLIEGECESTPSEAAKKFGFSRQRYFQLRKALLEQGSEALRSQKRGPKTNYRRTDGAVCQVIRHRYLDPEVSSEVIAQKLSQTGFPISKRSVDRIINEFGIQKKTLQT